MFSPIMKNILLKRFPPSLMRNFSPEFVKILNVLRFHAKMLNGILIEVEIFPIVNVLLTLMLTITLDHI